MGCRGSEVRIFSPRPTIQRSGTPPGLFCWRAYDAPSAPPTRNASITQGDPVHAQSDPIPSASAMTKLTGVFPIAPTPFTANGDLDLEGQRRVLDCMIDQGVDGVCILANYSEQFLLSDAERDILLDLCLTHVAGREPVIVTCSHFSKRVAAERAH